MKIGLVGCGRIANEAHVPAYALARAQLTAACDVDNHAASALARKTGASVSPDAVTLAQRDDVELIDVATPPDGRPELLRTLFEVGKPILTQKPLSYNLATAKALTREAEDRGVALAVNQNARWAPTHRAVYERLLSGDLGDVFTIQHHNRFNENVNRWYTRHPDYLFVDHGIHYLDLIRVLTGDTPVAVSAVAGRHHDHKPAGPVVYSINMRFADEATPHVALTFVNAVPEPAGFDYRLIVDGTRGSVIASLTTIDYLPHSGQPERGVELPGGWVPDGFAGALRSLIRHVTDDTAIPHSARDHVASLALAVAAARSARADGEWTTVDLAPSEVTNGTALAHYLS